MVILNRFLKKTVLSLCACACLSAGYSPVANADRIKDITSIAGVRNNHLIGYGLVVGLNGTGDQIKFTQQTFRNMLRELGVNVPEGVKISSKNVAAVALSADLPAFTKPGQAIDVTVSSIGDANSLRGGTLIMAPLKGADQLVYAIAQGNLVVSGFGGEGADGSKITVNVPSVGSIPNGAIVERPAPTPFANLKTLHLNLHESDFTTAKRVALAINTHIRPSLARALDATSIEIHVPDEVTDPVGFYSEIENLSLTPGEGPAKVVINSRTGTIVIGQHVQVMPAAVAHGSLTVTVSEQPYASQPEPFSGGATAVIPQSEVTIEQEKNRAFLINQSTSLDMIVKAINSVGAAPGDLVAILEALKKAGALHAELVVI